ncbi:MAG: hypothetical protein DWQ37_20015 [Planctomycetota bacterium]|nr:MAG: hypothetical protein DWQ37_20015 [Planctomycetota bacterium]
MSIRTKLAIVTAVAFTVALPGCGPKLDPATQTLKDSLSKDPQPIFDLAEQAVMDKLEERDDSEELATTIIIVDRESLKPQGDAKWTVRGDLSVTDGQGRVTDTTFEVAAEIVDGELKVASTNLDV